MASKPLAEKPLAAAITLAKQGKHKEARLKFMEIIKNDPHEVMAYLWLVDLLPNSAEQVSLLERCLLLNPESQMAKDALEVILEQRQTELAELEEEDYELPKASMAQYAEERKPKKKRSLKKLLKPLAWVGGIVLLLIIGYFSIRYIPDLLKQNSRTETAVAISGVAGATWTPLPTGTPTITPTPTPGLPVGFGTPAPPPAAMISAYDVSQLEVFSQWGSGIPLVTGWMADGNVVSITSRSIDQIDLQTGALISSFEMESPVWTADICSEEEISAVQTADGRLQVLSFSGDPLAAQPIPLETHYQHLRLSADCALLVGAAENNEVIIWDVENGQVFLQPGNIYGEISALAFSPDHSILALGTTRDILWLIDTATGAELARITETENTVNAIAFSETGEYVAFGSSMDEYLTIWNIEENRRQRTILLEQTRLTSLAYGDSDNLLAIGFDNGEIVIRDEENREIINHLSHFQSAVVQLQFAENSNTLLSLGVDGNLLTWQITRDVGKTVFVPDIQGSIFTADITPNGQWLALGGSDSQIHIIDIASQTEIASMRGHLGSVWYVDISADGKWLLSGGRDGTVRLWSLETFEQEALLGEHAGYVRGVAFSSDGRLAVSASADEMVKVYDLETQTELHTLVGHTDEVQNAFFSADGEFIFSMGDDGTLRKWDVETGRMLSVMEQADGLPYLSGKLFSEDFALVGDSEGEIDLWNTAQQSLLYSMSRLEGDAASMAFNDEIGMLAAGSNQGGVIFWDTDAMDMIHLQNEYTDPVVGMAFTASGREFFTVDRDGTVIVWDITSFPKPTVIYSYQSYLASAAINSDQLVAAIAGRDGSINALDLQTGELYAQIKGSHSEIPQVLAYSPGGNYLAAGIEDGIALILWDMTSGKEVFSIDESARVTALLFEPEGRVLMVARSNHLIERRDVRSGTVLETMRGHSTAVEALAFAPNEITMASGSRDGMIFIWDMDDNSILHRISAHSGAVTGLKFSDDGEYLYSVGEDGAVKIWRVANGELFAIIADANASLDTVSSFDQLSIISSIANGEQILFATNASMEIAAPLSGFFGSIQAQELSKDGSQLLVVDGDGMIQSYQVAESIAPSQEEIQAALATSTPEASGETTQQPDSVTYAVLLPAPVYYLSDASGTSQVWRLETDGFTTSQITFETSPITSFDVATGSDYLAFVSGNDLILTDKSGETRWMIQEGEIIPPNASEELQRKAITDLHFSPDGWRLSYALNGVHIYSILNDDDQQFVENLRVGTDAAVVYRPIFFSPGGNNLYIQIEEGNDLSLMVISSWTGEEYATFEDGPCCQPQLNADQDAVYFTGRDDWGNAVGLWLVDIWQDTIEEILPDTSPQQINAFPIQDSFTGDLLFFYAAYENKRDVEISLSRSGVDGVSLLQVVGTDSYANLTDVLWAPDGSMAVVSDPITHDLMILEVEDRPAIHLPIQGTMMRWGN